MPAPMLVNRARRALGARVALLAAGDPARPVEWPLVAA